MLTHAAMLVSTTSCSLATTLPGVCLNPSGRALGFEENLLSAKRQNYNSLIHHVMSLGPKRLPLKKSPL